MNNTGLNTTEGKLAVRHNAVRHGLRTRAIIIPLSEDEADWHEFQEGVIDAFLPANAVEFALAERVAELLWRPRRASQAERDVAIEQGQRERIMAEAKRKRAAHLADWRERNKRPEHPDTISSRAEADAAAIPPSIRVLPDPLTLQIVSKYEARLNRQLLHTLHELEAMQERRAGRATPLARIDVQLGDE